MPELQATQMGPYVLHVLGPRDICAFTVLRCQYCCMYKNRVMRRQAESYLSKNPRGPLLEREKE
jgi:hypothetical protein